MDVSLTYAVPVNVADLGANLQAYVESLPTLTVLRLCNRYGKGGQAFINKLPVELVKLVEQHLVQPLRDQHRAEWECDLACFEQRCQMLDHLTLAEKLEIYWDEASLPSIPPDDDEWEDPSKETLDRVLIDRWVDRGYDDCWDTHHERRNAWQSRVDRIKNGPSVFDKHNSLVTSHFGVDVWRSNVRLPIGEGVFMNEYDAADATVTYLTMPNQRPRSEHWTLSDGEIECGVFGCESGYGVPVVIKKSPTQKSLRRFARAMKILGLEVFVHSSQKGRILTQPDDDEIEEDNTAATAGYAAEAWPQLTLLTRSAVIE